VTLLRTDISEEHYASIIRVARISEFADSFHPDDEGDIFLRNNESNKSNTASYHRGRHSSSLYVSQCKVDKAYAIERSEAFTANEGDKGFSYFQSVGCVNITDVVAWTRPQRHAWVLGADGHRNAGNFEGKN
jgi:hypothetical protein